uniref:Uncharacterized protein n=1 Tax=Timema genevievae TaxID=629358 RepID=A0A7R9K0M0_TIMGE|nr:unnamed protein product [Timema genevievae]
MIIFTLNGLVVINKPYGMGLSPPGSQLSSAVVQAFNSAHVGNSYYLTETLPRLAKIYASGIGLLGASRKVAERVSACQKRAKPLKMFTHKYWAVGLGVPLPTSDQRKCGITLKSTPGGGKLVSDHLV